jgi:hypothetical protein
MGIIVTTSNGTRDKNGELDWIYDPDQVDGEALGFSWSAGAMSVIDALGAAGLADEIQDISGLEIPIDEADRKIRTALSHTKAQDDYLLPRLTAINGVIEAGRRHGATHLIIQ